MGAGAPLCSKHIELSLLLKCGNNCSGAEAKAPRSLSLSSRVGCNVPLLGCDAQDHCRVRSKIKSGERVCPFLPLLNRMLSVLQAQVVLLWRGRHDDKFIEINMFKA